MKIKLILPNKTLLEQEIDKVTIPGTEGYFQILPKHIDFVSSIKPGILTIYNGEAIDYFAVNYGILVKKADSIHISCLYAIKGDSLEGLSGTIVDNIEKRDEYEKKIYEILKKMEADTLRRFIELD
ncbi:MAG: hypothetical protein WBH44_07165 [Proteocatella sp.]